MSNLDVLAVFLGMFPAYQNRVVSWQPIKFHTIRVELDDGSYINFYYENKNKWVLGTWEDVEAA